MSYMDWTSIDIRVTVQCNSRQYESHDHTGVLYKVGSGFSSFTADQFKNWNNQLLLLMIFYLVTTWNYGGIICAVMPDFKFEMYHIA